MVTSTYILLRSGLNFAVYGTCNKHNPEACVITAEVCSIGNEEPTFLETVREGHIITAFRNEFTSVADTVATIPSRLRHWDAEELLPEYATFRGGYQAGRPTAIEVLDPGCGYCALLFRNIAEAGFAQTHNVSYIAYPIIRDGNFQFANSELIARYLTAIRITENGNPAFADQPTDWAILAHIFTQTTDGQLVDEAGPRALSWQFWFNQLATPEQATEQLHAWLEEAGYSAAQIAQLDEVAESQQVTDVLANNRSIVEDQIRTLSIPTLIANGRLHRGSVDVADLQRMTG
jgi:DNA-binding transcriptional MerR regulator